MMSRTARWSRQAAVMRSARPRPMPGISRRRSGWRSITSNTCSPKAATSFAAIARPMPLIMPEPR